MRQQQPLEQLVVAPDRISPVHQKTLIVKKDVDEHQSEDAK
jgi:hypothetical protein